MLNHLGTVLLESERLILRGLKLEDVPIDYFNEFFNLERHEEKDPETVSSEVANKGGLTEVGINALHQQFPLCMEVSGENMKNKIEKSLKLLATASRLTSLKISINKIPSYAAKISNKRVKLCNKKRM